MGSDGGAQHARLRRVHGCEVRRSMPRAHAPSLRRLSSLSSPCHPSRAPLPQIPLSLQWQRRGRVGTSGAERGRRATNPPAVLRPAAIYRPRSGNAARCGAALSGAGQRCAAQGSAGRRAGPGSASPRPPRPPAPPCGARVEGSPLGALTHTAPPRTVPRARHGTAERVPRDRRGVQRRARRRCAVPRRPFRIASAVADFSDIDNACPLRQRHVCRWTCCWCRTLVKISEPSRFENRDPDLSTC